MEVVRVVRSKKEDEVMEEMEVMRPSELQKEKEQLKVILIEMPV
jgi:hypothetical protein